MSAAPPSLDHLICGFDWMQSSTSLIGSATICGVPFVRWLHAIFFGRCRRALVQYVDTIGIWDYVHWWQRWARVVMKKQKQGCWMEAGSDRERERKRGRERGRERDINNSTKLAHRKGNLPEPCQLAVALGEGTNAEQRQCPRVGGTAQCKDNIPGQALDHDEGNTPSLGQRLYQSFWPWPSQGNNGLYLYIALNIPVDTSP